MITARLEGYAPTDPGVAEAARLLREGGVVAIPTETVYGLAADAFNEDAVRRIFTAKGRPQDNPLIVHISDMAQLPDLVTEIPDAARKLAAAFWPGPLTMVLPRSNRLPASVSAGLDTVAVRMPSNPVDRAVIEQSGCPLAAPSANRSGRPSPTAARHVLDDLDGRIDAVLMSGDCAVGVESTVILLAGGQKRLLRPGGVTREMLESVIGPVELDKAVLSAEVTA
ncbi:MAG: threonylcarbamoyl-AMP synthase, partial [Clostridia bacterium]|nr:threonylcarbamoyl-AMP synthase [Clostridia bacterium]